MSCSQEEARVTSVDLNLPNPQDIQESKEPPVFPLEKLLLSILQDARASLDVVRMVTV